MAEEIQIQGSGEVGKVRDPLGVIGLSLITCGIYFFVWYYNINKEMAAVGRARNTAECGDDPQTSLMAMVPGFCALVPPYVSIFNAGKRLNAAARLTGVPEGQEPGLMLVLFAFVSPVAQYMFQSKLNEVLQAQAGGTGQIAPGQQAAGAAPEAAAAPEAPPPPPEQPPGPPPAQ